MMKRLFLIQILALLILAYGNSPVFAHKKEKAKKGILLVTFGTSHPEARVAFDNIETHIKKEFPNVEVRWAFTSKIIRRKLRKRGEQINSPTEALAKMGEDGINRVAVQSLHIIPGEEYNNLVKTVHAFNKMPKGIERAITGKPLLFSNSDCHKMSEIINNKFRKNIENKQAVLFMGHGTHNSANIYYPGFQYYLKQKSANYFLATVEGFPELNDILPELKKRKIERIVLTPFMSVAGDHAKNDMAGTDADSWKSILEKNGFEVEIVLKGLAEYNDVVAIWINHLKTIYNEL
jgi:sirohydrochlorin cobaltochelatase